MRLILITGGGGAGVTTFAAATAVCAAARDVHTRLTGVDPTALARALGPPASWPARLDSADLTVPDRWNDDTAALLGWLRPVLRWLGLSAWDPEDIQALPGVRGLAALLGAVEGDSGLAVVDLGPADEALALLQVLCLEPSRGQRSRAGRLAGQIAGSLVAQAIDVPRPSESVKQAGHRLAERVATLQSWVRDPARSSLRVVLPADGRAAALTLDVQTFAGLWGIGLDALICRDAPPSDGQGTKPWLRMPVSPEPPLGGAALQIVGEAAYGDRSPATRLIESPGPYIALRDNGADLMVPVPALPPEVFHVSRQGDEVLQVQAGRWRRTFILPPSLHEWHGRRAWHDGSAFRVRFEA